MPQRYHRSLLLYLLGCPSCTWSIEHIQVVASIDWDRIYWFRLLVLFIVVKSLLPWSYRSWACLSGTMIFLISGTPEILMASSKHSLVVSQILLGSIPHDADKMTFGLKSLILPAKLRSCKASKDHWMYSSNYGRKLAWRNRDFRYHGHVDDKHHHQPELRNLCNTPARRENVFQAAGHMWTRG